jgi:hypothetical protein
MLRTEPLDQYGWWSELKHGGLLIAPARLADYFPETLPRLPDYLAENSGPQSNGCRTGSPTR